tara:strand:+ start:1303 stop:1524 length:222 start_codon:yes stop_codon:yes gene_type:complete
MKAIKIVAIASIALNLSIIGGTIGAYFYLRTPAAQEKIKKALIKSMAPDIQKQVGQSLPEIPAATGGVIPFEL